MLLEAEIAGRISLVVATLRPIDQGIEVRHSFTPSFSQWVTPE